MISSPSISTPGMVCGRLPVARYLAATLAEREALMNGAKTVEAVAKERGLSSKYLRMLWGTLSADKPEDGTLPGGLQERWRKTESNDPSKLVSEIDQAQKKMWKFNSIGHIGREGGPPRWMEPVGVRALFTPRQNLKWELPAAAEGKDIVFYLATGDAGDGNDTVLGGNGGGIIDARSFTIIFSAVSARSGACSTWNAWSDRFPVCIASLWHTTQYIRTTPVRSSGGM